MDEVATAEDARSGTRAGGERQGEALEGALVAELPALREYLRRVATGAARGEVEDLVQEAVARALRYHRSFAAGREIGPWLRGIALRVLIDHRARLARAPATAADVERAGDEAEDRLEQLDSIERALERLSEVEREVVVRFHGRDETIAEIAERLSMPVGTVKSHLHRARRKLGESAP
jgi:RNA polymerase sigma-70 factor (ECF subfamily)